MPPIVAPEERASFIQASPAEKPLPRGFVAAVPTSPTPSTPLNPPALQPPPPSHYLRNRNRNSGDSDLFIKRSEIYTRVQRVLPSASNTEDSTSGLLFGSDFHADWTNTRLGRSTLSAPRYVVASPIHATHTPAAPLSAEPRGVNAQSNPFSNYHSMLPPRARDEDNALDVSPSVPASGASKEKSCRRPFRTLLRQRLTVKVASRSVEAAFATQPSSSTDDLPRQHSTELYQQDALAGPPSPGSSASSAVYESSCCSSETDIDKKGVPPSALQKGHPPTPPSPFSSFLHTPPSASISLLEAQKVRRAKACDKFTRYTETTPFQFQRGAPNNAMHAAPVPALTLHSAREIPTEAPVQMQWTTAIELHRVSSAPDLKQRSDSQPQPQPQPRTQQPQPQLRLHPQWQSQSHSQLVSSKHTLSPPPLTPPQLSPSSHATSATPAITTSTPAPEGKPHRRASASGHHRRSTGGLLPSVGSLRAILRPRSHSKATATGVH